MSCGHPSKSCGCCYLQTIPHTLPQPGRPSAPPPSAFEGLAQVLAVPCLAFLHVRAARALRDRLVQPLIFWWSCRERTCPSFLSSCRESLQPPCQVHPGLHSLCSSVQPFLPCALNAEVDGTQSERSLFTHLFAFPLLAQNSAPKPPDRCLVTKARLLLKYLDQLFRGCSHGSVFCSFPRWALCWADWSWGRSMRFHSGASSCSLSFAPLFVFPAPFFHSPCPTGMLLFTVVH